MGSVSENMFTTHGDLSNIIAVMGMTGSGKSTLIKNITGQDVVIGHNLEACTASVYGYQFIIDGVTVTLVDTPGFDDTYKTDTEVLAEIHGWLSTQNTSNVKPKGILFMQRISDNRMSGSSMRFLEMFNGLCGEDCMKNVTLVTTMWGIVDEQDGERRHKQLCEEFWKPMILNGAKVAKYDNDSTIINIIKEIIVMDEVKLRIIKETDDQGLSLGETSAAQVINKELIKERENFAKEKRILEDQRKKAVADKNKELKDYTDQQIREQKIREAKHKQDIDLMKKKQDELIKAHNKKLQDLKHSDATIRIAKRCIGSLVIAGSLVMTPICPPAGVAGAGLGGGLIGSSFAKPKPQV